jgi:hypothetical protein
MNTLKDKPMTSIRQSHVTQDKAMPNRQSDQASNSTKTALLPLPQLLPSGTQKLGLP